MTKKILLLDCHHVAWTCHFAAGFMKPDDEDAVVRFFLNKVLELQEWHKPTHCVFCFDLGVPFRRSIYPEYKANRVHDEAWHKVRAQTKRLRKDILPSVGFKNIFGLKGYEADDLIAAIVLDNKDDEMVIVANDKDFYQLLSNRVSIWNSKAKTLYTKHQFKKEHGIRPSFWSTVKAIEGCSSDNINGIEGVGKKTALKYLKDELPEDSPKRKAITSSVGLAIWNRNIELVRLPYPGTPVMQIIDDKVRADRWVAVTGKLGFSTTAKSEQRVKETFK